MNETTKILKSKIKTAIKKVYDLDILDDKIKIEIPKNVDHKDYASNIAMRLTKEIKKKPFEIAEKLVQELMKSADFFEDIEIAGPGFLNFELKKNQITAVISKVLEMDFRYGEGQVESVSYNLEYVSANPTGDLHPGHARGAAIGDSVARIMKKAGYKIVREYYINDAGNQIHNLALSVHARYLELFNQELKLPEDGYRGADIIEIAEAIKEQYGDRYLEITPDKLQEIREFAVRAELEKIKEDLHNFRVEFDHWGSEQSIYDRGLLEKALVSLKERNMSYEKDGATWLETTRFGDDKDRVLRKSDGTYTYMTPDIGYHLDKLTRAEKLVDFLGADHHGYIGRMRAALQAFGYPAEVLEIDIIQMATMVKDGQEFKMSKRSGKSLALRDLVEEAGVDATRYFFASRAADAHMEFDVDLASKKSNDNPVFYVQYAHARMCSILKQATRFPKANSYDLLISPKEIELLKHINELPTVIQEAAKTRQPHKICNYVQKLASLFHSFYGEHKVIDDQELELSAQRFDLVRATKITLANALELIGVSAPESM